MGGDSRGWHRRAQASPDDAPTRSSSIEPYLPTVPTLLYLSQMGIVGEMREAGTALASGLTHVGGKLGLSGSKSE